MKVKNTKEYMQSNLKNLELLKIDKIKSFSGLRHPLDWDEEEKPIYSNKNIHFYQLSHVEIELFSGHYFRIITSQDNHEWGLCCLTNIKPSENDLKFSKLENKTIDKVRYSTFNNLHKRDGSFVLSEIILTLDIGEIVLVAGEVEPGIGNTIIRNLDESVLFFLDINDYYKTEFNTPLPFTI